MRTFAIWTLATATTFAATWIPERAASGPRYTDDGHTIAAVGDGRFFIGDCTGKSVELTGNHQTIALVGTCKAIVAHGNDARITFDEASSLRVVGNGNVVKWKTRPTRVTVIGRSNVLTRS
jgi:hypothetical protein